MNTRTPVPLWSTNFILETRTLLNELESNEIKLVINRMFVKLTNINYDFYQQTAQRCIVWAITITGGPKTERWNKVSVESKVICTRRLRTW